MKGYKRREYTVKARKVTDTEIVDGEDALPGDYVILEDGEERIIPEDVFETNFMPDNGDEVIKTKHTHFGKTEMWVRKDLELQDHLYNLCARCEIHYEYMGDGCLRSKLLHDIGRAMKILPVVFECAQFVPKQSHQEEEG